MPRFRAYAQKVFARNAVEIMLLHEHDGRQFVAQPLVFAENSDEGSIYEPTLCLRVEEAQELMDALWDAGLRPTEGSGSAGSLAATERHLADMRGILQKKGIL